MWLPFAVSVITFPFAVVAWFPFVFGESCLCRLYIFLHGSVPDVVPDLTLDHGEMFNPGLSCDSAWAVIEYT